MAEYDFSGKTALVTGAASGMGLCFSQNVADLGCNVVMCDINMDALKEAVDAINAKGKGKAIAVECDTRSYEQVCQAVETTKQTFGSIDFLVPFAGGTAVRMQKVDRKVYPEFPDVPIEVYDWGLDVNLKGPFYFSHAALKVMREQKSGVIVLLGSVTGEQGSDYGVEYAVAKSGLMKGLTKSLAAYGAPYGIRCVCVAPGPVLTRAAMANMKTAIGRAAEPQEIIDLILFLISDKATFITGECVLADGGRVLMQF